MKRKITFYLSFALICFSQTFAQWVQTNGPDLGYITCMTTGSNGRIFAGNSIITGGTNGLRYSDDGGNSWQTSLDNVYIESMLVDNNILYAGAGSGSLYISTDNGQNWTEKLIAGLSDGIVNIVVNGNIILIGTGGSGVFSSSDGGTVWIPKNNGLLSQEISGMTVVGSEVYLCTTDGGMSKTADNGDTWTAINSGFDFNSGEPSDLLHIGNTLYLASDGGGVYKSTDMGQNWVLMSNGITQTDVKVLFTDGSAVFAGSHSQGTTSLVYVTADGGQNWMDVSSGLPAATSAAFTLNGGMLFFGTANNAVRVWKRPLSEMVNGTNNLDENKITTNILVAPNPANNYVVITTDKLVNSLVSLTNLNGQVLQSHHSNTDHLELDVRNIPAGVYLITFSSDAGLQTMRLIKE